MDDKSLMVYRYGVLPASASGAYGAGDATLSGTWARDGLAHGDDFHDLLDKTHELRYNIINMILIIKTDRYPLTGWVRCARQ